MIYSLIFGHHQQRTFSFQVCDALMNSEKLRFENREFLTTALAIVRKIINGVDYKGRDTEFSNFPSAE